MRLLLKDLKITKCMSTLSAITVVATVSNARTGSFVSLVIMDLLIYGYL